MDTGDLRWDVAGHDLKGQAVRGGAVTMVSQWCKVCLNLGSTAVLARMLLPEDFGLVAMVAAVVGFLSLFKDMGLSMATIQRTELAHEQVNTLFWFNVAVSIALALLVLLLAPVMAMFYREPRLTALTACLGFGFVLSGLTIQHQAILRRQMRFWHVAVAEMVALVLGVAAAIGAAFAGLGYWSLVIKSIVTEGVNMVAVWLLLAWRPTAPAWSHNVRSMLSFGAYLTGFNALNYFARNLDNILIGWYWGARPLGFYSRAYGILVFPLAQITAPVSAVAIPTLSRLQADPKRFRGYYLRAVSIVAFLAVPLVMYIMVMSREVVMLLLGPQWSETAHIFRVMAISMLIQPVMSSAGWLYVATGQTRRMFIWGAIGSSILVASFVVGLPFGPRGVALAYSVAMWAIAWPVLWFGTRHTPVQVGDILKRIWWPYVACLPAVALAVGIRYVAGSYGSAVVLLSLVAIPYGCVYLAVALKFAPAGENYAGVLKFLRNKDAGVETRRDGLDETR